MTGTLRTRGGHGVSGVWASVGLVDHANYIDLCPKRNGNALESFNNQGHD